MMRLSNRTAVMAIQAIDEKMRELEKSRKKAKGAKKADFDEALLAYSLAAEELEKEYSKAQGKSDNLPEYSKLVKGKNKL